MGREFKLGVDLTDEQIVDLEERINEAIKNKYSAEFELDYYTVNVHVKVRIRDNVTEYLLSESAQ